MSPSPRRRMVAAHTARFGWQFVANCAVLIAFHQFILTAAHY